MSPQPVAVLSYKFWQKRFLSDPDVVGKTLQLDRKNYAIVGVAAPRFTWYSADVYLPLKLMDDPAQTKRELVQSLKRLLDVDFDTLLFAHGEPIVGDGKQALRDFLASNPAS